MNIKNPFALIGHFQKYHNTLYLPSKILDKHCFYSLLGLTMVPRETKINAYAKQCLFHNNSLCKIWGANRVHYGQLENSELRFF